MYAHQFTVLLSLQLLMPHSLRNIRKHDKIKIVTVTRLFPDVFFLGGGSKLYLNHLNECFIKCFKNSGNHPKGGCMAKRAWKASFRLVY